MSDFQRLPREHDRDAIYPGVIEGLAQYGNAIVPLYVVALVEGGRGPNVVPDWTPVAGGVTTDPSTAVVQMSKAVQQVREDKALACCVVILTHASQPDQSWGDAGIVHEMYVHPLLRDGGRRDFWPVGRLKLFQETFRLVRQHFGFDQPAQNGNPDGEDAPAGDQQSPDNSDR